jgi:hypothetical protein
VADQVPFLSVVRGDASDEEIAALVATLTAVAAAQATARAAAEENSKKRFVQSEWNSRARQLRTPVHPAPAGWRRSALP